MHPRKKLTGALKRVLSLIEEEAERNSDFAARLDEIAAAVVEPAAPRRSRGRSRTAAIRSPDVFAAYAEKGGEEFRFWLTELDLQTLKAIVKNNGFDPGKITRNWNNTDKYIDLIVGQVAARLRRGSSFLTPRPPQNPEKEST